MNTTWVASEAVFEHCKGLDDFPGPTAPSADISPAIQRRGRYRQDVAVPVRSTRPGRHFQSAPDFAFLQAFIAEYIGNLSYALTTIAREHDLDIGGFELIDVAHSEAAAAKAVQLIHEGKAELLMKGSLHTDELMRAVTASATGLRTARRISHVFMMDVPNYPEKLFIADAAIKHARQKPHLHAEGRCRWPRAGFEVRND